MEGRNLNGIFMNIINKAEDNFVAKEELIDLHTRTLMLESNIKLRKDMEKEYSKLKIEELKEDIDDIEFQKKHLRKRNDDLIDQIQRNDFTSLNLASKSNQALENLLNAKKKYQDYLNYQLPVIKNDFTFQLHSKNNLFLAEKAVEENKIKQNQELLNLNNEYQQKLLMTNTKLMEEIRKLREKNAELMKQKEQKNLYYNTLEQNLENELKGNDKPIENNLEVNFEEIKGEESGMGKKSEKERNSDNFEGPLKGGKKKYITIKDNFYVLNDNHTHGQLDEIIQEKIDKENKKLEKKYIEKINKPLYLEKSGNYS